ncbi:hypothetical protein IAU59_001192 [Kwoniella sp. CBS 9459]
MGYIRKVYIVDLKAAEKFIQLCHKYEDDVVEHWKTDAKPRAIFPNLEHLNLGSQLLSEIATAHTFAVKSIVHALDPPPIRELCKSIHTHAKPSSLCLSWPHGWERPEQLYSAEDFDDMYESTLAIAIDKVVLTLEEEASFQKVRIHIHAMYLCDTDSFIEEKGPSASIVYDIIKQDGLRAADLVLYISDHLGDSASTFASSSRYSYIVPKIRGFEEELEEEREYKDEIQAMVTILNEKNRCPCNMWEL